MLTRQKSWKERWECLIEAAEAARLPLQEKTKESYIEV